MVNRSRQPVLLKIPISFLRQHGLRTTHTRDRDFRKFEFLEMRDPFQKF